MRDLALEFGAKPERIVIVAEELRENRPIQQPIVDDRHANTLVRHGRTRFLSVHGSGAVTAASEPTLASEPSSIYTDLGHPIRDGAVLEAERLCAQHETTQIDPSGFE
jgi:hypothetical protein